MYHDAFYKGKVLESTASLLFGLNEIDAHDRQTTIICEI